MIQYNTLNVKVSNSQLNTLKSGTKNGTERLLNLPSNVIRNSNDDYNFAHNLLLTNTQIWKLLKAFANGSSANVKLSKTHLHKIRHSGRFLGRLLRPLLKIGLPLMKNVLEQLTKSVLIPLGLTIRINSSSIRNKGSYSKEKF